MGREIKFRLWDTNQMKQGVNYLIDSFGGVYFQFGYDLPECISAKVMQFTGLLDCNDKEIYEGSVIKVASIIRYTNSSETVYTNVEVLWDNKYARWGVKWENKKILIPLFAVNEQSETIGNIYENPELLETKE